MNHGKDPVTWATQAERRKVVDWGDFCGLRHHSRDRPLKKKRISARAVQAGCSLRGCLAEGILSRLSADKTISSPAGHVIELEEVRRITWIGLVVNLLLTALKFAGGLVGASQAVMADAAHSLSDLWTDIAILVGSRYWSAPADDVHPHGHRRIETLITTVIGLSLAAIAVGLIYNAVVTAGRENARTPNGIALSAALVSIIGKEVLYRLTVSVGRRIKSPAVLANAQHHRSDGLSSIPAAAAVGAAMLKPGWMFLDHVGAVIVSLFIFHAAWGIIKPSLGQLVDAGASAREVEEITAITGGVKGVGHAHAVRTRYSGSGLMVDLHIHVDGAMTVREGHDISEEVKKRLMADGPDIIDVVVHIEPRAE